MPKSKALNQTEMYVLLSLRRLDEAYGVTIRDEIRERAGRDFSVTAVYAALDRLERLGYARSRMSAPLQQRGGRARKHFHPTPAGLAALDAERDALARMWDDLGAEAADR